MFMIFIRSALAIVTLLIPLMATPSFASTNRPADGTAASCFNDQNQTTSGRTSAGSYCCYDDGCWQCVEYETKEGTQATCEWLPAPETFPGREWPEYSRSDILVNPVSETRLEHVCELVPGADFDRTETQFGCFKEGCNEGKGSCFVVCVGRKCFGRMPDKPVGGLTMIGILQNGDNVVHIPPKIEEDKPKKLRLRG